ncbi:NAD(P)/FAD-dependent oxidoreductase [Pseudooctadecabacter jejudonensis]|nr:NAD(P)/FAD-dependent oxidoreductase [Pseudooctadecabacter jejudonensis]
MKALVIDDHTIGWQAGTSSRIENDMGFPVGISGGDLVWRGEVQAMKFGPKFAVPRCATRIEKRDSDRIFCVTMDDDAIVCARSVIVATDVQYQRLPIDRLKTFEGIGIYCAATEIEARHCSDTEVVVIGGGNSAGQAAMFLSRTAKHVYLLVRGDTLAASMSDYLLSRLQADPAITIHYQIELEALHGDRALTCATTRNKAKGETLDLDDKGFVISQKGGHETSHPGIFAVGDVRSGSVKRVASALGEGSVVMSKVWEFVNR